MSEEARLLNEAGMVKFTAAAALASGEVIDLGEGRPAVVSGLKGFAIGDPASAFTRGRFAFKSASATTFAVRDPVYWDVSANLAITEASAEPGDLYLGPALKAKTSGQLEVEVDMGECCPPETVPYLSRVVEFDCDGTEALNTIKTLIPAARNKTGLILLAGIGRITEVFAGAAQDQGIVTLEDSDGTDLGTLTPSDAGADAVGDVVLSTGKVLGGATGDAIVTVAAGKGVQAKLTQIASGAGAAGKIKVRALVCSVT